MSDLDPIIFELMKQGQAYIPLSLVHDVREALLRRGFIVLTAQTSDPNISLLRVPNDRP